MTTAPARPILTPSGQLTIRTDPSRRRVAAGSRPTAQQKAETARQVTDTYPELLAPTEFDPTTFPRHEGVTRTAEGVVRAASREVTAAAGAVEQARALTARATPLLVETTPQPRDINALATLLDQLPQLADAMGHKVIPLLAHFDQPDLGLNHLLDRVSQLSQVAIRLLKVFRWRSHRNT